MTDITSIFGGAYEPNKYVEPPEVQLADAMRAAGLDPPSNIRIDGQLHRFSTKGRKRDDSGWYVGVIKLTLFSTLKCSVNSHLTS